MWIRYFGVVRVFDAHDYHFGQGGIFIVDTEQLQNNSATATPIYVGGASLVGTMFVDHSSGLGG